jgi:RHS repeat-associated protein
MASLAHVFTPTGGNQTWSFAFTPASQIASSTSANAAWDWPGADQAQVNKTYDGLNRDATIAAMTGGYDKNGNLTFDGARTFAYDAENRLVSESGPVAMSLAYDPLGRLQQSTINGTVTQFLYDGEALVAEYDGSGNVLRRYVHGPQVDNPLIWYEGAGMGSSNANYLIADRQGSIVANASGAVTANYVYDSWGVPAAWGGSRFRYTGQIELPEAQLYHYKARVYDPVFGRFLQTDPIGGKDDLDLYAYVGEDPMDRGDPTGLAFGLDDLIGGGVGMISGVVIEVGKDALTGEKITAGKVAGAALQGTIYGVAVANTPETAGGSLILAGAVAGLAGNTAQQGIDNATGEQHGYDAQSAVASTAAGAAEGLAGRLLPGVKAAKVTTGRNSFAAVAKSASTKLRNGSIRHVSMKTSVKAAVASTTKDGYKTAAGFALESAKSQGASNDKKDP